MKKWSNKKAEWLLVMLAVSLTASASWTITAEEKSEAIDRYIIVELETLTAPNVDAEEMELSSESEQSTDCLLYTSDLHTGRTKILILKCT